MQCIFGKLSKHDNCALQVLDLPALVFRIQDSPYLFMIDYPCTSSWLLDGRLTNTHDDFTDGPNSARVGNIVYISDLRQVSQGSKVTQLPHVLPHWSD